MLHIPFCLKRSKMSAGKRFMFQEQSKLRKEPKLCKFYMHDSTSATKVKNSCLWIKKYDNCLLTVSNENVWRTKQHFNFKSYQSIYWLHHTQCNMNNWGRTESVLMNVPCSRYDALHQNFELLFCLMCIIILDWIQLWSILTITNPKCSHVDSAGSWV